MEPFQNILVDIDAAAATQPALELAARLARRSGARIRVVDILSLRGIEALHRWPVARFGSAAPVDAGVLSRTPEELLIEEVERGAHDLVVRSQARDLAGSSEERSGGVNVHLIRRCPCAVWTVGAAPLPAAPKIVAAVNASAVDREGATLNTRAIEMALYLAELEGGSVTVLHAWRPVAEKKLLVHATEAAFHASLETAHARADADLGRLVDHSDHGCRRRVSSEERPAGGGRARVCRREGTDVLVMGVRAGNGIWNRLFRNTAERVLERAPGSLVAVKAQRATKRRAIG